MKKLPIFTASQIVFIDSQILDYQSLAKGVYSGIEVVVLDSQTDGIEQITKAIANRSFSAIHIVSHGSPGCLYLGNTHLSLDTIDRYSSSLKAWSDNLCILFYGCQVAAGDAGTEFITKLRNITNVEIAASNTLTGNSALGGNWELEYATTPFSVPAVFQPEAQQTYQGVLVTVSGTVFIDYNNDGTQQPANDAAEIGYEGIEIIAYDDSNNVIASTFTDSNGDYSLVTNTTVPFRIEFDNLPEGFAVSSFGDGANSVSDILFLDGTTDVTANLGINRPSDVTTGSTADIDLVTACYVLGIGNSGDSGVIVSKYNNAGNADSTPVGSTPSFTPYDVIADFQDVGTVYGIAHHRQSNTVFTGSFYKRHSALLGSIDFINDDNANASSNNENGTAYTSVIYTISNDGSDTVTEFVRLDDVVDPRGLVDNTYDWEVDATAFANVGKVGLGDIELSEDGKTLWTVNLNDNKLYQIPVGDSTDPLNPTPPAAEDINSFDVITKILNSGGDLGVNPQQNIIPFALSIRDGLVYIGMVNTAQFDNDGNQGNTTSADLEAFVYTFDPNNPTAAPTQILDIPLNYERDQVLNFGGTNVPADWNPWTDDFADANSSENYVDSGSVREIAYPQPILSDIDFDPDGNMILGFRDRWGDQLGYQVSNPNGDDGNSYSSTSGGDILQALYNDTNDSWTIETHVTTDGISGNEDPDGEFYRNEFLEENNNPNDSTTVHAETAQGGLTVVPGVTEVVTTAMDPVDVFSGGFEWFDTTDGSFAPNHQVDLDPLPLVAEIANGLEIFDSSSSGLFGKANGLSDLEFIAAPATVGVGDRIWFDSDADGIQDVGEVGVPDGVTVELYDASGTLIDSTATVNGNYSFTGLEPFSEYQVRLVASDFATGAALEGYQPTLQGIGNDERFDSDAAISNTGLPIISFTTDASGTNNATYDIGLVNNATLYDYGDAPDTGNSPSTSTGNYQTTQNDGGARHLIGDGLTIGNSVGADDGTLQNTEATADTDDGVTFTETLETTDTSFSVDVDVNLPSGIGSATLVGWIDFNRDGVFDNTEAVSNTVTSSGTQTLIWNSFPNITDGTTYARFRLSSDSNLNITDANDNDSTVELNNGEVEDYQITIGRDYGDAPDTIVGETGSNEGEYATTQADGGASHGILNGLSIGSIVDADSGTLQNFDADADDINNTDDEDGVTFTSSLSLSNETYSVDVDVTNTTGRDALLTGWIDFDHSGTFDTDEAVSTIFSTSGSKNITWTGLDALGVVEGTTYARFRLSTEFTPITNTSSTIYEEDFEGTNAGWTLGLSEDTATAGFWEFGNPTFQTNTGTGTTIITQPDGANTGTGALVTDASNVDVDGGFTRARSETFVLNDGTGSHTITFSYFLSSVTSNVTDGIAVDIVNAADTSDTTRILLDTVASGASKNAVWTPVTETIDSSFNGKTVYLQVVAQDGGGDDTVEAGIDDITVTYTDTQQTQIPLDSTGALNDGEVEDYLIDVGEDYGDAPDTTDGTGTGDYQTIFDHNGARHIIVENLKIGSLIDADPNDLQNAAANADDTDGTDDEDGVTFASNLKDGDTSFSTTVKVTNNTGQDAKLVGWIDFDLDGIFEASEAAVANIPTGNTDADANLTWDINTTNDFINNLDGNGSLPTTVTTGITYARFRLSTDTNFDGDNAIGAASDGEVEDYKLTVNIDYGDARDTGVGTATSNYNTTANDNGASHIIDRDLTIGYTIDADDGTLQNGTARADDADGFVGQLNYEYYDLTAPTTVADIPLSGANAIGTVDPDSDLLLANQNDTDNFGIRYNGNIYIKTPGTYTFYTTASDGSTLTIDDTLVVDNSAGGTQSGTFTFGTAGYYPIEVEYIQNNGTSGLTIEYESTDASIARTNIPASVLSTDDEDGISSFANLQTDDNSYSVDVVVNNNTDTAAQLIGWIDFDHSGTFDADEAVTASVPNDTTPGDIGTTVTLDWNTIPTDIIAGFTYARFRLSSDENLTTSFATGQLNDGEVEDYLINIEGVDYGDAPDIVVGETGTNPGEYSTTQADGGASHIIVRDLKIGATVDAETGTLQNTAATADDNDNNNDDDDEDGVTFPTTPLNSATSTSYSVDIEYTDNTGEVAALVAWIDFDQSGTFDADEAVYELESNSIFDQTTTFTWDSLPADIVSGTTYARFRLSTDFVFSNIYSEDFEGTNAGWTLGVTSDTATAGVWEFGTPTAQSVALTNETVITQPNGANTGTGALVTDASAVDVDSGFTTARSESFTLDSGSGTHQISFSYFLSSVTSNPTDEITVDIINAADTSDTTRILLDTVASGESKNADWTKITRTIDSSFNGKTVYLQIIAQDGGGDDTVDAGVDDISVVYFANGTPLQPTGALDSGEVEDYQIIIEGGQDYGDAAGSGYDAVNTSHSIVNGLEIGSSIDNDATPVANTAADGDDINGIDDEEGVTFTSILKTTDTSYSVSVDVTNTNGAAAELIGWIDFNQNGTFEAEEASTPVSNITSSGSQTLTWSNLDTLPDGIAAGDTYARFRLNDNATNLTTSTATGALDGGEVEDYLITAGEVDYGDAPDTGTNTGVGNYRTTDDDDGASHLIVSGLSIGTDVDGDSGDLANTGATADDTDGVDDEDGVTNFELLTPTSTSYSVDINVTNTSTTDGANLVGWIDFDRDGNFEASEASNIITDITSNNDGTQTLTWSNLDTLTDGITSGVSYARFRLTTDTLTADSSFGTASDGEVEDYQLNIAEVDYGDAPDTGAGTGVGNYQTTDKTGTANDGPSHIVVSGLTIGSLIDGDSGQLANETATADDTDNIDDDDGVTEFDTLAANALSYSLDVDVTNTSTTGANLVGWIDFDGDGEFEASEASNIISNITDANDGIQTLTWSNLDTLTDGINSGTSYVRLRYTTDTLTTADSTGAASDGEVEDYQITIAEVDYGDAPDTGAGTGAGNYETTDKAGTANDGASHGVISGLSLGTEIDGDSGNLANTAATADDFDNIDDEDGIASFDALSINTTSYSVNVDVTNTLTTGANLVGWIDFDDNGVFEAEEASNVITGIGNTNDDPNNASQTLTWSNLDTALTDGIKAGTTYARFRLSSDTLTTSDSTGVATNGEVEDYQLTIEGGRDYGDADTTNGTGDGYDAVNTSHDIVSGLSIGNSIDNDPTPTANDTATADDNTSLDDEDGINFTSNLKITDTSYSVEVEEINTNGATAELIGWIDFNQNGTFEASEASDSLVTTSSGIQTLSWSNLDTLAGGISAGTTYARFRLNDNATNLTPSTATGALDGGEVEDYLITVVELDYGDAAGYETLASDTNPTRHGIVDGLRIGNAIDADTGNLADATATADDTDGVDDEDGVTSFATLAPNSTSYTVNVNVTNTLDDAATLVGWIDFNGNGTFEASEASDIITGITSSNDGTQTLTWSNLDNDPDAIVSGDTYARIRLSTDALTANDSTGEANDGEVEDYQITIADVDYGDAPDTGAGNSPNNYETTDKIGTVDDGPSHVVVTGLSLGTEIDGDNGNLANATATADDTDGIDDEDGVASFEVVAADATTYTTEVEVTNTLGTAANLVGWIDFDGDGFFEATEASDVVSNITTSGTQTLTWSNFNSVLGDVIVGTTYARIRLSSDTLAANSSNGAASDGEVEDYSLITVADVDYGDAPDTGAGTGAGNYETTNKAGTANDGASHIIVSGLYMGADNVDGDNGDLESVGADADDTTGVDDEDGVASFDPLTTTTTNYSVTVNVTNITGNNANLIGWIDFNGNGVFETTEASNLIENITDANDGNLTLTWSNVSSVSTGVSAGDTYARFRLSNDTLTASNSTGALNSGEVEDYSVTIQAAGQDYGDAATGTDSYASNTTNHDLVDGLRLGNAVDNDDPTPPTPNVTADADDLDGVDDEDGVTFTSNLTTGSDTYSVTVDVTNTNGATAELIGWIDFNQNGTFESSEASDPSGTITSSGTQTITWSGLDTLPGGISVGDTYARFRLNDNAANLTTSTATGALDGGEVEDYLISVCNEVTGYTYPESLTGTSDSDCITGLDGQDTLTGGDGDDIFVYTKTSDGIDLITDFAPDSDKLDFRAIANNELSGVTVVDNLFDDGYIKAINFGSGVMIQVDPDAEGSILAKNVVLLRNEPSFDRTAIDADDFMF